MQVQQFQNNPEKKMSDKFRKRFFGLKSKKVSKKVAQTFIDKIIAGEIGFDESENDRER